MLAFVLLAAATATTASTTAPATSATEPTKNERLVCKTSKFVGSHISQRICKTESEWQMARRKAQEALDDRGRGNNYEGPWKNTPK